eukprot:1830926-Pyramimonas_sp.AAC.1
MSSCVKFRFVLLSSCCVLWHIDYSALLPPITVNPPSPITNPSTPTAPPSFCSPPVDDNTARSPAPLPPPPPPPMNASRNVVISTPPIRVGTPHATPLEIPPGQTRQRERPLPVGIKQNPGGI